MRTDEKLLAALRRYRTARLEIPRLQDLLTRANGDLNEAEEDFVRVVKALGKAGKQLVYFDEILMVHEDGTVDREASNVEVIEEPGE